MGNFSLLAKLGLDTVAFESGAKRAQSMATKLGSNLKGTISGQLGAALGVASIIGFTKSVINLGDEIGDLSEQMNISTDDVQRLQVAAGQTGVKFETIAKGLVNVGQARLKAVEGAGKERAAFEALGLSLEEVNNGNITNIATAQKLQVAFEASGKSAEAQASMIEIFGVKAFQSALAINSLKELGPIELITQDQIKKLGEVNDKLDEQYRILKTKSAPAITGVLGLLNIAIEKAKFSPAAIQFKLLMPLVDKIFGNAPSLVPKTPTPEELVKSQPENLIGAEKLAPVLMRPNAPLGQGADSFAKIGLFGGFQSTQDRMIKELQTQANYLKYIQKASEKTADAVGQ